MEKELLRLSDIGIESKLKEIWSAYTEKKFVEIGPVYQKCIRKNVVTFLSLNPSLPPKEKGIATRGNNVHTPFDMIDSTVIEGKIYPFYKKHFEVGDKLKEPWTSIDLLYIRDSTQKNIEEIYKNDGSRSFITTQVQLTLDILKEAKPKLVVVANRFVETILLQCNDFTQKAGLDTNQIYRYEGIPFIMRESGFMGSRRTWESKSEKNLTLKEKMYAEIRRVLIKITEQEIDMLPRDKMGVYKSRKYEEVVYWRDREKYLTEHLKELTEINA